MGFCGSCNGSLGGPFGPACTCTPEPSGRVTVQAGSKLTIEVEATIPPGKVLVDRKVYERAVKDANMLHALEAAGVDNWEGYEFALAMRDQP